MSETQQRSSIMFAGAADESLDLYASVISTTVNIGF
jgi:hypothetical protein